MAANLALCVFFKTFFTLQYVSLWNKLLSVVQFIIPLTQGILKREPITNSKARNAFASPEVANELICLLPHKKERHIVPYINIYIFLDSPFHRTAFSTHDLKIQIGSQN